MSKPELSMGFAELRTFEEVPFGAYGKREWYEVPFATIKREN